MAYLVPYMICLPLLSSALLQRWPRMFWGVTYENALFLHIRTGVTRRLAFTVTPKGITSDRRKFDFSSAWVTLIAKVYLKKIIPNLYMGGFTLCESL